MTDHPSPWVLAAEPTSLGDPAGFVTLVNGQTFSLSDRSGDFSTNPVHGVFFADMRVLSEARLLIGGAPVEPLAVRMVDASSATYVGRSTPAAKSDPRLLVVRRRRLGSVWHEDIELMVTGSQPVTADVELVIAADFADVYALKEGRLSSEGEHSVEVQADGLLFRWRLGDVHRRAHLRVSGPEVQTSTHGFRWQLHLEGHTSTTVEIDLSVALGESWIRREHHAPRLMFADDRHQSWIDDAPTLRTWDRRLSSAYDRSVLDVAALRLHDPLATRRPVIAAGAPWYMTLFGRDALLSSYMTMPVDPRLALGVLDALAELQGTREDTASEEEPGKIPHETRALDVDEPTLLGGTTYYGSVDATPLFVMMLGEASRWGLPDDELRRLLPHAERAMEWIAGPGDRDRDGFVEYQRMSDRGLVHQGWKDSVDGIRHRDGSVAEPPLALCEVQAYVYAAHLAMAHLAERLGDRARHDRHQHAAAELKRRFNDAYWMPDLGWFAVALGKGGEHVGSLTSNIGHCLWTGIVDDDKALAVVERLTGPEMFTGWGIRTLASDEAGYDPMSYHCGTVWPHDTALFVAGLRRYGFHQQAVVLARGLVAAAAEWDGRLPELFAGLDRNEVGVPVPFPTSCSPQAWAAATPFLLLRVLLGIEPTAGSIDVDPLPGAFDHDLFLGGVRTFTGRFDVHVDDGTTTVTPSAPLPFNPR